MNFGLSTDRFLPLFLVAGFLTACDSNSESPNSVPFGDTTNDNPSVVQNPVEGVVINEASVPATEQSPPTQPATQPETQPETQPDMVVESTPEPPSSPESQPAEMPVVESQSSVSSAQQAQLPEDCLLTQDSAGVAYCFSPATRKYTAVLTDGRILYEFNLPGDNATNSVKGLFIGPENSDHDVCLVADITVAVDDSEFEISCFEDSGEFVGTVPTLTTPPRYGDPVKPEVPQGVNVNNEPLLVAQAGLGRVFIAGTRYTIDPLADPAQQDAWQRQGSFVSLVNAINGRRVATHRYSNRTISSLNPTSESLIVTFDDGSEQDLELSDLGPLASTLAANRSVLSPENLVRALPTLISVLEGTQFEQFDDLVSQYTDALLELVDPTERWPDTPLCPESGPPGCEQTVTSEPLRIACSISGTASVVFGTSRDKSGSTRRTSLRTLWEFDDQCVQAIDNNTFATLSGILETTVITTTSVPGDSTIRFANYDNFSLKNALEETTSINVGSWFTSEQQSARDGTNTVERIGNFTEIIGLNGVDMTSANVARAVVSSQGSSRFSVDDVEDADLGYTISIPTLGLNSVGSLVETPLFTGFTKTASGFRFSQTRGLIHLFAQDGSSAMLTLSTDAPTDETPSTHTPGQELVDYIISHDGVETTYQSDTSGFYIPTFVD